MSRRRQHAVLSASIEELRRRLRPRTRALLNSGQTEEADYCRELRKLSAADRRAVRVIVQRIAEIEASQGADAADEALEGVFNILLRERQRASA